MPADLLEFEEPVGVLLKEIEALSMLPRTPERERSIDSLRKRADEIRAELYANLTPWQRVLVARHPNRPNTLDYVERLFTGFDELHGDRRFADDHAHRLRLRRLSRPAGRGRRPPEGARHQAEDLPQLRLRAARGLPQGAARDAARAEVPAGRSSSSSTRRPPTRASSPRSAASPKRSPLNLREMMMLEVPIVVIVCGEGGSGGALGIAIGDRVLMQEFSVYSVIPPEGCAAILWRDANRKVEAAAALKITAPDLLALGLIDAIVPEPPGGAHNDHDRATALVDQALTPGARRARSRCRSTRGSRPRYEKFRRMGAGRARLRRHEAPVEPRAHGGSPTGE